MNQIPWRGNSLKTLMSVTKAIYLHYDFDLRADYENWFIWLDSLSAKECCRNCALIQKTFEQDDADFIYECLKSEINQNVTFEKTDRLYVCFIGADGQLKGKFLFGGRKRALWQGYAASGDNFEDSL